MFYLEINLELQKSLQDREFPYAQLSLMPLRCRRTGRNPAAGRHVCPSAKGHSLSLRALGFCRDANLERASELGAWLVVFPRGFRCQVQARM